MHGISIVFGRGSGRRTFWPWLAVWCLAGWAAIARDNPLTASAADFFVASNLYTFHLTIASDQWAVMEQYDQPKDNAPRLPGGGPGRGPGGPGGNMMGIEFKEGTANLAFDGQPFGAIKVRFKGNSSFKFARNSLKRSLKLDFNDVEKGRTFFGLTKLNLNNNAMDPSQLRETLAYQLFRAAGVAASRTAFAKVFITVPGKYNMEYAGLYTVVEQVDERFLKSRFGVKDGLLLKPERIPGLPFLGNDWAAYTNRFETKTKVNAADTQRFIEFVQCLNHADDSRFQAAMGDFMEVDEFLRFLALEALLSNLDSPLMTGHNYYLYLHSKSRKFVWIPWDLNEAFGGFFPGGSASEQMDLSVDKPYTRVNQLAERLLKMPGLTDRYHATVRGLLATNFNAAQIFPLVDRLAATIRPALTNDRMVSLSQFEAALSETSPPGTFSPGNTGSPDFRGVGPGPRGPRGPKPALKAFVNHRVDSAQRQLDGKSDGYAPREMRPMNGGPGGPMPGGPLRPR